MLTTDNKDYDIILTWPLLLQEINPISNIWLVATKRIILYGRRGIIIPITNNFSKRPFSLITYYVQRNICTGARRIYLIPPWLNSKSTASLPRSTIINFNWRIVPSRRYVYMVKEMIVTTTNFILCKSTFFTLYQHI